jgi:hypothetical protein
MMMPTSSDAMFYFYTNELEFSPEFMGRLKLMCGLAGLLGILAYNRWFSHVGFKQMFSVSALICSGLGCTSLLMIMRYNKAMGISDEWFSLSGGFLAQAFAELNTMPILILCCQICPKSIEASLYSFLMSTINLGTLISYQLGALFMIKLGITSQSFDGLWAL